VKLIKKNVHTAKTSVLKDEIH